MKFVEAIAHIEGFYAETGDKPNRPQRNNNPGDLEFHSSMREKYNAVLETGTPHPRFAHFPDVETGFGALNDILWSYYAELSVYAAINKYAPPSENDTNDYVTQTCERVGCLTSDIVASILTKEQQNNG